MSYTALAVAAAVVMVILDLAVLRTRLLRRRVFWVSYAIMLVGQLLTDGLLARRGVVTYDPASILAHRRTPSFLGDGRVFWAPVEDILFGFAMILLTLSLWVFWGRRGVQPRPAAGPPRWRSQR